MTAFQKYAQLPIDAYSSQATGQFLLDGCRRDGCGIQPAGLWVATFGPSKVAKIKADAGVNPTSALGVHIGSAIPMAWQHQLLRPNVANDTYGRIAA
ncbi:MAG: hypothetical protein K2Q07_02420 [Burkholderiaceae bacterium]|nr:hypothetical protein [Burkholderiaceae bacterium]